MLQQQTAESEIGAAQIRVTPHEFVQATAAIEARHDARAQHEAATIPIGEAVQQLNLPATPEEVLAEVQSQRAQSLQTGVTQKRVPRSRAVKIMSGVIAAQFLVMGLLWMRVLDSSARISDIQWQHHLQSVSTSAPASRTTDANDVRQMNPTLFQSLDLKEGQSAHCSINEITALARGANPANIWVTKKMSEYTWSVARQGGKFRVLCYTTSPDAVKIANGQPANVSGFKDGDSTIPITLPLEKFADPLTKGTIGSDTVSFVQINGR